MGSYISTAMNFSPGFCPWQGGEVGLIYCQALLLCFADLALQVFYISFPTGLYFFQPNSSDLTLDPSSYSPINRFLGLSK